MAFDGLQVLQASVTKAASFNSTGVDFQTGTTRTKLFARVLVTAATSTTTNTATFTLEHSDDNSTFYALGSAAADVLSLTTTNQTAQVWIPILTPKRYIRLVLTTAGGGTPSVTYQGEISFGRDGI